MMLQLIKHTVYKVCAFEYWKLFVISIALAQHPVRKHPVRIRTLFVLWLAHAYPDCNFYRSLILFLRHLSLLGGRPVFANAS